MVAKSEAVYRAAGALISSGSTTALGGRSRTGASLPVIAKGKGGVVVDVDGNEYIDFTFGQGATILGHADERVVVAMRDPNPDVTGGGIGYLKSKGLQVTAGVCLAEARRLNEVFIKFITTGRPFVTLKCAATLDGHIATRSGDSKWITNEQSRGYVHHLRHCADGILVGVNTVKADDPSLTTRLDGGTGKDPG